MKKICLLVHTGDQSRHIWPVWHRYWKQNFEPHKDTLYRGEKVTIDTVFLSETHADVRLDGVIREYTGTGIAWGKGLIDYLNRCSYDYVIYHHEDYLLVEQIDTARVFDLCQTMVENNLDLIKCCGWWGGYIDDHAPYYDEGSETLDGKKLWRYNNASQYLISHQSSIWKKEFLLSTLLPEMTPWGHELTGTELLRRRRVPIYAYRDKSPIEYAEVLNHKKLRPNTKHWFTEDEIEILRKNNCL